MLLNKNKLYSYNSYNRIQENLATNVLNNSLYQRTHYDIFLSHSYDDRDYIGSLFDLLSRYGYKVYVDWIVDKSLVRGNVNKNTASILKSRMSQCSCLLYVASDNTPDSKWMPWELGYFDGLKNGKVAILPIVDGERYSFEGQEYLGLYPYINEAEFANRKEKTLWVHEDNSKYVNFKSWLDGAELVVH